MGAYFDELYRQGSLLEWRYNLGHNLWLAGALHEAFDLGATYGEGTDDWEPNVDGEAAP